MKRTSILLLIKISLAALLFGWVADSLMRSLLSMYVFVGGGTSIGLALTDIALVMWGLQIRHRLPHVEKKADGTLELHRAKNPLAPLVAARTAAFAMAASRTGAALAGFYGGLVVYVLPKLHVERAQQHAVMSTLAVVGAIAMTAIALWIERRCSPPTPPTESATTS